MRKSYPLFTVLLLIIAGLQTSAQTDSCHANFEASTISNSQLGKTFTAIPWHSNNKRPEQICWSFGDGRDTCINYNPAETHNYAVHHLYSQPGVYNVCVKIKYQGGCEAFKCKSVAVGQQDSCSADLERIPTVSNNTLTARFRALTWHSNQKKPSRICWTFGDTKDTCIYYPENYTGEYTVTHIYPHTGNYEVCVKILYNGGCEAGKCRLIQLGVQDSCRADFERIPVTNSTLTTSFRALPWHNHEKKPSKICWTFGDGRDTCIQYPENYSGQYTVGHHYATNDSFEVCVKILYYGGCEAHKCKRIIISPPYDSCKVRLFEITPSVNSLTRGFYAIPISSSNRNPERICWYFGDGEDTCIMLSTLNTLPQYSIRHTYPAPGLYRACVKVLFAGGCIASECKEVVIRSASNICGGFMLDSLVSQFTFKFRGQGIQNVNDAVAEYRWSLGDGSTATGREVRHTYSHSGTYEVCLRIKTERGCETHICKKLQVPGVNESTLQLSPNPVINELHVSFISNHNETISIKIFNSNGMMVRNYMRIAVIGTNTWNFDVASLTPGIYSVVVQSPNQLASGIFFKQ
jgi:PKD repeat protein